jgi:hypothetical protein
MKKFNFKQFLNEESEKEYSDLLDKVATLFDTVVGDNLVWVKNDGQKATVLISGEDYVLKDMDGKIIKTQKLYKDGEITNYSLGISRLKEFIAAIENEQFV